MGFFSGIDRQMFFWGQRNTQHKSTCGMRLFFFLYFQARHSQAFSVIIWEETTKMTKQVITKTQWTLFKEIF